MIEKIILSEPRGFCAGVDRAIEIVELALGKFKKVYVRKEIVHNKYVVDSLRKKGAVFVETLDEVPENSLVIFSAHGVSPEEWKKAKLRNLRVIDATCPLVTKVHIEAIKYAKEGYDIILIGHNDHDEVIGTMGEAPNKIQLVENINDIEKLKIDNPKIAYLTQTTLSINDTAEIIKMLKKKFPHIKSAPKEDICYATQNRQNAVKELSKHTDLILVIGSKNSSNSTRLMETAISYGTKSYIIDDAYSIKSKWLEGKKTIGITSGASVPEYLVKETIDYFKNRGITDISAIKTARENIRFTLPKELK